jgi:hypothetical protein
VRFTDPDNRGSSNPRARRALVDHMAQQQASFLAITGDLVRNGDDLEDWEIYDSEAAPLRAAGIKVFPVLGNHDLHGDEQEALAAYFKRFPELRGSRYYSLRFGPAYFLMLDSNLSLEPGSAQRAWVEAEVNRLPADVQYLFVTMHHPIVTRSRSRIFRRGHSALPEHEEFGRWLEQRAANLRAHTVVFAGHVHNYERYVRNGVTYVVSGGGGGRPHRVRRAADDVYQNPGPAFHYCRVTLDHRGMNFEMVELVPGQQLAWRTGDSFSLAAVPQAAIAAGRDR